jgi:predicted metal-dependent hydrolase
LVKWYKLKALEKIEVSVAHYGSLLGVKSKSITLKNYKSRWGACSAKGDLIFNWQIITFNQNLFNYVVAHEICHLKEMNHSRRFYQLLEQLGFNKKEIHSQMRYLRNLF